MKLRNERKRLRIRRTTLFLRNISQAVKAQFKAWCAKNGLSMNDKIEDMMRNVVRHADEIRKSPGNELPRSDEQV